MKNIGVVIVTYNSADVIRDCLGSLCSTPSHPRIVVVDNASTDDTVGQIKRWKNDKIHPPDGYGSTNDAPTREVLELSSNNGFAAGVNAGLRYLMHDQKIDRFWILNPDTVVDPDAARALSEAPEGFALMGHRILYAEPPHDIQIDGGTISRWTGVTGNLGLGASSNSTKPDLGSIEFISGASMVASRAFIEQAGLMPEDYFLYYEEVDWAMRRKDLPLAYCENAFVYHHAGTAIGSPTLGTPASPFSVYFKHRARMMFLRRFFPLSLPLGYLYGMVKSVQHLASGQRPQAIATLKALHGKGFTNQ